MGKIMEMRCPIMAVLCVCVLAGCASKAPAPVPTDAQDSVLVNASFEDAWQAAKQALADREFTIHTRDKRGIFVAYEATRRHFLTPHRTKYTVVLESVSEESTQVTVEAKDQRYWVTLLTYPTWQDTAKEMAEDGSEILRAIEGVLSMGPKS